MPTLRHQSNPSGRYRIERFAFTRILLICTMPKSGKTKSQTPPEDPYCVLATNDTEEVLDAVRKYYHDMKVEFGKNNKKFKFILKNNLIEKIQSNIQNVYSEKKIEIFSPESEKYYFLSFITKGEHSLKHQGSEFDVQPFRQACLVSPTAPADWKTHSGYSELSLNIDRSQLESHYLALTGRECKTSISFDPHVDLQTPQGQSIRRHLEFLVRENLQPGSLLRNRVAAVNAENMLLTFLLMELDHSHREQLCDLPSNPSPKSVSLAEEYIEAHADEPMTVADLAGAAKTSIRSLQRGFRKFRGYTPMEFLKSVRLDRARTRLLAADASTTITEVALATGFNHLGDFSTEYRRRFGEMPSATLASKNS